MQYRIGQEVTGTVTGIQPYGAFVSLDEQTQGLIHISECTHSYVEDIGSLVTLKQVIRVKILDIDEYTHKISLSLRALTPDPNSGCYRRKKKYWTDNQIDIGFSSIERLKTQWEEDELKFEKSVDELQ